MGTILRIAFLLIAASTAPTQNLLKWDKWEKTTTVQPALKMSKTGLQWHPYCGSPNCRGGNIKVGVKQSFTVTKRGYFRVSFRADNSGTGAYHVTISLGWSWKLWDHSNDLMLVVDRYVYLLPGKYELSFITSSTNIPAEQWNMRLPSVTPNPARPVALLDGRNIGLDSAKMTVEAPNANLLAMSAGGGSPIALPGIAGTLRLNISTMVILGTARFPGIKMTLPAIQLKYHKWPKDGFHFQAATWKAFGAPTHFKR